MGIVLYNWAITGTKDLPAIRNAVSERMARRVFDSFDEARAHIFVEWRIDIQHAVINISYRDTIYPFIFDWDMERKLDAFVEKIWAMEQG